MFYRPWVHNTTWDYTLVHGISRFWVNFTKTYLVVSDLCTYKGTKIKIQFFLLLINNKIFYRLSYNKKYIINKFCITVYLYWWVCDHGNTYKSTIEWYKMEIHNFEAMMDQLVVRSDDGWRNVTSSEIFAMTLNLWNI